MDSTIRVLFVFSDRSGACTAKRTFEVVQALHQHQRHAISADVIYFRNLTAKEFEEYEIIVFQRLGGNRGIVHPDFKKQLFEWMDQYREQTIYAYDIDDYVFEEQNSTPISMMERCHTALAPNDFIAQLMRIHQPRCHVIRTHIDLQTAEKTPKTSQDPALVHIGWFSIAAQGIDVIDTIYPELLEKWNGKIQIHAYVDQSFIRLFEERFSQQLIMAHPRVSITEMYSLEKGMDILINPLNCHDAISAIYAKNSEEKKFNFLNSKSEIKYLHAGAAKKPLIVTPIQAYSQAIVHGVTGFLAETADDWMSCIELLANYPEIREQVGNQAYKDICEKYTYKQVAFHYAQFFQELKKT